MEEEQIIFEVGIFFYKEMREKKTFKNGQAVERSNNK